MKKSSFGILLVLCLSLVFLSTDAGADPDSRHGHDRVAPAAGGSGRGGGGNGGNGGSGGNQAAGALYGDLYVLERDGKGAPIMKEITYTDPTTGGQVTVSCVQPISKPTCTAGYTTCSLLPLNAEKPDFNPELEDPCTVQAAYTDCLQAVTFGRESVARASATVIDMSYGEALNRINSAAANQCVCDYETIYCSAEKDTRAIKLNPAGLMTLCVPLEDGTGYAWATMDAPLENLGLYREIMKNGCFGKVTDQTTGEEGVQVTVTTALDPTGIFYLSSSGLAHLVCAYGSPLPASEAQALEQEAACTVMPDPTEGTATDTPCWWESPVTPSPVTTQDMLSSTAFIAAGADKTSPITLDEIVNVDTYLGINTYTYTRSRNTRVLNVTYFPFAYPAGTWFTYTRGLDGFTPTTQAYILTGTGPAFTAQNVSLFSDTVNGVNLNSVNITVCRGGAPLADSTGTQVVCNDAATNPVYSETSSGCGGANWFTQAAEDSRKTIWFVHNWAVPVIAY